MDEKIIAGTLLNVLLLEDSVQDFEIIREQLIDAGYHLNISRVEKEKEFASSIRGNQYDIILADFKLPEFNAFGALRLRNEICPNIPFICVSGAIGEETAIELIKQGAVDYVLKDRLARLPFAIKQALDEAKRKEIIRRALDAFKESEKKYRLLADNVNDVIFVLDMNLNYTYISPSVKVLRGYEPEEVLKQQSIEKTLTPSSQDLAMKTFSEVMELEKSGRREEIPMSRTLQLEMVRKDESTVWTEVRLSLIRDENQKTLGIMGVTREIAERRQAEEALRREHVMLTRTERIANIGSWEWDIAMDTVNWSDELFRIFQRDQREGAPSFAEHPAFYHPDDMARLRQAVEAAADDGIPYELELRAIRKDGETRECVARGVAILGLDGRPVRLFGSLQDITERKRTENKLRESEERFRRVSLMTSDIAYSCITGEDGRFSIEWITGATDRITGYSTEEIKAQGCWRFLIVEEDVALFEENVTRLAVGSQGNCELRIRHKNGGIVWLSSFAECFMALEKPEHFLLYGGLVDITERKQAEEKIKDTLERLRKAVDTTIQVMVSAIEVRDPYTSGHQVRSAGLALAIATNMGLPQDKIEGIRMAGSVHDIGKLSLPAEILSKPTKLSEIEFSLVKEHALQGYKILKNVESPWPLAEIVYQHHERMDGSGYPRKLKGNDILMEARILIVADVVEAMASHRPYRPAFGIDAALEEIEKNRGTLYDAAVVDACLRLFREKGYQLEVS